MSDQRTEQAVQKWMNETREEREAFEMSPQALMWRIRELETRVAYLESRVEDNR